MEKSLDKRERDACAATSDKFVILESEVKKMLKKPEGEKKKKNRKKFTLPV